ncbi:hypothetical protein FHW69_002739 [Luteibacter sp. Sphag1AF]|nr:hypothetical protein [Luteibacter sp. Sphag1AF]
MTARKVPRIVAGIIVLIPALYFTSCSLISGQRARAFEQVHVGDTEQQVIDVMGKPADRETAGGPRQTKYGVAACTAPCMQRLWYPNSISLAGEAWSVDIGSDGHVVNDDHITSP